MSHSDLHVFAMLNIDLFNGVHRRHHHHHHHLICPLKRTMKEGLKQELSAGQQGKALTAALDKTN